MRHEKAPKLTPCKNCKAKGRMLGIKVYPGGARFVDQYAIECYSCGERNAYQYSVREAAELWNRQGGDSDVDISDDLQSG